MLSFADHKRWPKVLSSFAPANLFTASFPKVKGENSTHLAERINRNREVAVTNATAYSLISAIRKHIHITQTVLHCRQNTVPANVTNKCYVAMPLQFSVAQRPADISKLKTICKTLCKNVVRWVFVNGFLSGFKSSCAQLKQQQEDATLFIFTFRINR